MSRNSMMMRSFFVRITALFCIAALFPGLGFAADAPLFTPLFPDDAPGADKPYSLDHFHGKPLLVAFWRSDCVPCVTEQPIMLMVARAHPEVPMAIISLQDKAHTLRHFVSNPAANVKVLLANGDMKTVLQTFGDEHAALPFSMYLRADGSSCHTRYGLLGSTVVDEWAKQC